VSIVDCGRKIGNKALRKNAFDISSKFDRRKKKKLYIDIRTVVYLSLRKA
jgi:hypothetical protein